MKTFDLTIGEKSYKVDVEQFDGKHAVVKVDGKPYRVDVTEPGQTAFPAPAASPPASDTQEAAPEAPSAPEPPTAPVVSVQSGSRILAPMPGLILEVMVSIGDRIVAGTPVVKMEAMKMENEIPAAVNGTVKEILVKAGDPVSTDETLLVIDQE